MVALSVAETDMPLTHPHATCIAPLHSRREGGGGCAGAGCCLDTTDKWLQYDTAQTQSRADVVKLVEGGV